MIRRVILNKRISNELERKFTTNLEIKSSNFKPVFLIPLGIGFIGGGLGSLVGLGGGFIMIPMFTKFCFMSQKQASAISLTAVIGTSISGGYNYYKQGNVDVYASLTIASTAILLSVLGARLTSRFNEKTLKKLFGLLSLCIAPTVPLKDYLLKNRPDSKKDENLFKEKPLALCGIGSLTGFVSGFFGVGGGGIATPLLCYISSFHQQKVLGTTIVL